MVYQSPVIDDIEESRINFFTSKTLLGVTLIMIYIIYTRFNEKTRLRYFHATAFVMILGIVITLLLRFISPEISLEHSLVFNDQIFFNLIIPPMIFAAGYTLDTNNFFSNFHYIMLFGFLGTLLVFFITAPLTAITNSANWFYPYLFSIQEILLFSVVISATDTISALTFMKEEQHPKLYSILFGEGILNDALCIVLYQMFKKMDFTKYSLTFGSAMWMFGYFLYSVLFSLINGIFWGFASSLFFKHLVWLRMTRIQEIASLIFFGFISYCTAELLEQSSTLSLLFTGIIMSHYTFYNLSFQGREESSVFIKTLSIIAEAFVYVYLGLTFLNITKGHFSWKFILTEMVFVTLTRLLIVWVITGLANYIKKKKVFPLAEKIIMFLAGSIRGSIAFGLAVSIKSDSLINDEVLISSTLVMVLLSTIIFSTILPFIFDRYQTSKNADLESPYKLLDEENKLEFVHPNSKHLAYQRAEHNIDYGNIEYEHIDSNWSTWRKIKVFWKSLDEKRLKPFFVYNWPECNLNHLKLADIIGKVSEKYRTKDKQKIEKQIG